MNWRPAALLPLMLALSACADGGTRGSGISTTVLGNVAHVQTAARPAPPRVASAGLLAEWRAIFQLQIVGVARARTDVEGIHVAVEGASAHARTDANGDFSVQGDFAGSITVVFELPDAGGRAQIDLNAPAAGRLTLNNVAVHTQSGEASAESQDVDFEAIITGVYCQSLTMGLVSSQQGPDEAEQYTLRLETSSVRDADGNLLACEDIPEGVRATVQGKVNPDATFCHATVELE